MEGSYNIILYFKICGLNSMILALPGNATEISSIYFMYLCTYVPYIYLFKE